MRNPLKFILILLIAAVGATVLHARRPIVVPAAVTQDGSGEGEVPAAKAYEWIATRGAVFVDSSEESDFKKGRIAGALHLPLDDFQSGDPEAVMELPHGVPIVVYCRIGCDSSQIVAQRLRGAGFSEVFVLGGGLEAWIRAGYPSESHR